MVAPRSKIMTCVALLVGVAFFREAFVSAPRGALRRRLVARAASSESFDLPAQRRQVLLSSASVIGPLLLGGEAAHAKKLTQEFKDDFRKGYKNLKNLLDNFEVKTTDPVSGSRMSEPIRAALGLRSTTDPLFRFDKKLLLFSDSVNPDFTDEYSDALERWNSAVSGSNADAFISQFGEFNPGGGTETIEKYLERSRELAVKGKQQLEIIAKCFDLTDYIAK